MRTLNAMQASDVTLAALGLAMLELHRARVFATMLPQTAGFESHCEIGLAIGAAGRRIETLIPVFIKRGPAHRSITPDLPSEWLKDAERIQAGENHYKPLYEEMTQELRSFGLCTYDLCSRLAAVNAIESSMDDCALLPMTLDGRSAITQLSALSRDGVVQPRTERGRRGPSRHVLDPRWNVRPHDESLPRMPRIENDDGLRHKLHNTAFRETLASQVAALNLLEYDGLPWDFYVDMARQCEDEARHALITAEALRERGGEIGDYPISYLGNYYEMFWEMNILERFVAMNIDIEAVGQQYLVDVSHRLETIDAKAAQLYDFISSDETRHARIGARWLEYLLPDPVDRRDQIDACRNLLLVNLASAHAAVAGGSVADAFDKWLMEGSVFRFDTPRSQEHEPEITPLLSRRMKSPRDS